MLLLIAVSTSAVITVPMVPQFVLASLLSAVGVAGISRLHDKANEKEAEAAQAEAAKQPSSTGTGRIGEATPTVQLLDEQIEQSGIVTGNEQETKNAFHTNVKEI